MKIELLDLLMSIVFPIRACCHVYFQVVVKIQLQCLLFEERLTQGSTNGTGMFLSL